MGSSEEQDSNNVVDTTNDRKSVLETNGFLVGDIIGTGTYAQVKYAYSEYFQCPVAIKIISKIKAPKEYLTKFIPREIDVIKGLKHENLIRFYQSIETTHRVYIIMQYAENGSLFDLIRNEKYLNENVARKYFKQLINVLGYCHSKGIVHRDIKCENLLLDQNMNLKLIDFGFARKIMNSNNNKPILSETYCGSYAYASPEVLKGFPYDPRYSDIWASGVVLFAMVFGRLPFNHCHYAELIKQINTKRIYFPEEPQVSALCKNLIRKILSPLKYRPYVDSIKKNSWYNQPIECTSFSAIVESSKKLIDTDQTEPIISKDVTVTQTTDASNPSSSSSSSSLLFNCWCCSCYCGKNNGNLRENQQFARKNKSVHSSDKTDGHNTSIV